MGLSLGFSYRNFHQELNFPRLPPPVAQSFLYQKQLRPGPELIQESKTLFFNLNKLRCGSVIAIAKGHAVVYRWPKGLLLINFLVPQYAAFPQITNIIKLDLFQSMRYALAHLSFLHWLSPVIYYILLPRLIVLWKWLDFYSMSVYFPVIHWSVFFIQQKYININCLFQLTLEFGLRKTKINDTVLKLLVWSKFMLEILGVRVFVRLVKYFFACLRSH